MLLSIRHRTSYTYEHPVELEPHCLRLTPRADAYGSLIERSLIITPEPVSLGMSVENDGSISHWAWFKGETRSFIVESKTLISLLEDKNPFDFLVYPASCLNLPMTYPLMMQELQPFLTVDKLAPRVRDFAFEILEDSKGQTMDFLVNLSRRMKREFVYEFRHTGAPFQPEDTLDSRRGSCRDWAILYMVAARAVGLAARFVSGYFFDEKPALADLHAWVEVYVPGGGWRGFDPSLGIACYGHHIALATGASAGAAAPIQGHYKGRTHAHMKLELEYHYLTESAEIS